MWRTPCNFCQIRQQLITEPSIVDHSTIIVDHTAPSIVDRNTIIVDHTAPSIVDRNTIIVDHTAPSIVDRNTFNNWQEFTKICKTLNHKLPCSSSPYIQNRPNRVCEFCCKHTPLFEMMCHLYFSRYKLFNYKFVHIVKPNVLRLNKDFFFIWVYRKPIFNFTDITKYMISLYLAVRWV